MSTGKVVQVIGPVVDIAFEAGQQVPDINNALVIDKGNGQSLTVEVSLALGDGVVRTIAMDSTDGSNEAWE
jgi:F-type H+-transporting ATPase subunit beta